MNIINWEQWPNQDPYFMVIGGILLAWLFVKMYLNYTEWPSVEVLFKDMDNAKKLTESKDMED